MVAQVQSSYVPLATYYELEEAAETKSEYFDGVIVAMSGGSLAHVKIIRNLSATAAARLQDGSCEWFPSELLVYSPACNTVFYPDLTMTCAEPAFAEARLATLLNPTLIIEVLSDSSEGKDRGEKFACYRSIVSLSTYVLVSQNRPMVEVFTRQDNGLWQLEEFIGLEAVVPLPAIGISLPLTDIYTRVRFPARLTDRSGEGNVEAENVEIEAEGNR